MSTNRSWINNCNRLSDEFLNGVEEFMKVAYQYVDERGLTCCPCKDCLNLKSQDPDDVRSHIYNYGFQVTYKRWYNHGEAHRIEEAVYNAGEERRDEMADLLDDVFMQDHCNLEANDGPPDSFTDPPSTGNRQCDKLDQLVKDMETALYPGCKNYSVLNFLVKLMHLKVTGKWSNHSFDGLLDLLLDSMPEGVTLPKSHYEARAKLRNVGLGYESIDMCKNDCSIFWKEYANLESCHVCGEIRWQENHGKGKKVAHKRMRYFALTPRLRKMHSSRYTAEDMR